MMRYVDLLIQPLHLERVDGKQIARRPCRGRRPGTGQTLPGRCAGRHRALAPETGRPATFVSHAVRGLLNDLAFRDLQTACSLALHKREAKPCVPPGASAHAICDISGPFARLHTAARTRLNCFWWASVCMRYLSSHGALMLFKMPIAVNCRQPVHNKRHDTNNKTPSITRAGWSSQLRACRANCVDPSVAPGQVVYNNAARPCAKFMSRRLALCVTIGHVDVS